MANTVLVGAQWGDEGKGKVIDYLTDWVDVVVRSQGGNNAGHTVVVGDVKYILRLIPSGILRPGKLCVIGNGVVVDPISLCEEIGELKSQGVEISKENLLISEGAHLVFPYHKLIDEYRERAVGPNKIGTTKRGIGPAYGDKIARVGIRLGDLLDPNRFKDRLDSRRQEVDWLLEQYGAKLIDWRELTRQYLVAGEQLREMVTNTVLELHRLMQEGKEILFEGAQGTFLDIDHGTYPYVTSSNTTAGGACTGTGVPPHRMDRVVGVMKAYSTRVGEGALPTEDAQLAQMFHNLGREFGATTGRKRRCGWFDAVATRYARMINGIDELAITNLDGLDHVDPIRVCVAYRLNGKRLDVPPCDASQLANCEPIYEKARGWNTSTQSAQTFSQLPPAARNYVRYISELTGAKLSMISVGPE